MSTRSLTVFQEGQEDICVLYKQWDGDPRWWGRQLCEYLASMKLVDGIPQQKDHTANGIGCLAAQTIAYFKDGIGDLYLYPSGTRDVWEAFRYIVEERGGPVAYVSIYGCNRDMILYEGYADNVLQRLNDHYRH